jgi:outer membrane protein assembly factor BamB
MGFEGSVDTVSFGDILNTLCHISKEGVLTVKGEGQKKVIHFRNNGITLIGGTQRIRVGDMVVQYGKIQPWQLENALIEQKQTNKLLGEILVEQGLVTQDEIEKIISEQIEQEIFDIFFWENAYFSFQEGSVPESSLPADESQVVLAFDVQSLLLRIADQIGEWEEIRKEIPSFSLIFVLVADDVEVSLPENENEEEFQKVLQCVDGIHEINEIIHATKLPVLAVCRVLYTLQKQEVIRLATFEELLQLADHYQQKNQSQRQLHFMETALAMRTNDQELLLKICQTYDSLGGKDAGKYYYQLGNLATDAKQAMQYFERAISCLPKEIAPREKLIESAKYNEDTRKELYHVKILIKLYQEEKKYAAAIPLCQSYIEQYSQDIDLHNLLIAIYLEKQDNKGAIEEYMAIASIMENKGDIKQCLATLQKILPLDSRRDDVAKKIKRLQRSLHWQKNRYLVVAGAIAVVFLVLVAIGYLLLYEFPARKLYRHADAEWLRRSENLEEIKKIHEQIQEDYQAIIAKYGWSTVAQKAQQSLDEQRSLIREMENREQSIYTSKGKYILQELKRIAELAKLGNFEQAKAFLAKYKREYEGTPWQPAVEETDKIVATLEQKNYRETAEKRWQAANKFQETGEWEQAVALYKILRDIPEYSKEAETELKKVSLMRIEKIVSDSAQFWEEGLGHEKQGNFKSAVEVYRKTEMLIEKAKVFSIEATSQMWEKLIFNAHLARQGIQRIEEWEQQAKQALQDAQKLESENKFAEASQKVCQVVDDRLLSKTEAAQQAHLAFKIETEPPGAKIHGSDSVTPHVLWVRPQDKIQITLERSGFLPFSTSIDRQCESILKFHLQKKIFWQYDSKGPIWGRVTVLNNMLIATSRSGKVIALHPKNGKPLWETQVTRLGDIVGGAVVCQDDVYLGSTDQYLYTLHRDSGKIKWKFQCKGFIQNSPIVEEHAIYVGTSDGVVYAIDRRNGQKLWEETITKSSIKASPLLWSKNVIFATTDGKLLAWDMLEGKRAWAKKVDGVVTTPVVAANQMFLGTSSHNIVCLDMERLTIAWQVELEGDVGSLAVAGGYLYIGTDNGFLYRLARLDGQYVWKSKLPKALYAAPLEVGSTLYVGCGDSSLYMLDSQTGQILWQEQYGNKGIRSDIVLQDNIAYLATENGILYALEK